ncbi:hypothetical protein NBRC10513_005730 [Rhodotorula toruloides]
MRETASAAADNDSASQMKVEEVEEDLPDAGVVRQPSKGVSQRVPIDSANQILNNFPDIPLYVVSKLAPPDDLVFPSEMDLMFTRKVTGT